MTGGTAALCDPWEGARLFCGDCTERLRDIPDNSLDSCVTDPPYHLTTVKRFGKPGSAPPKANVTGYYSRASAGFLGKEWDGGDISFRPELWAEVYRVLKPGAFLLAFSGTRTHHRMVCAIEDAGFDIRDCIFWCYGKGFPKSHDISKSIDKRFGSEEAQKWQGWGTTLKPAVEPICVARKPPEGTNAENVMKWGTGALNIDGCRIEDKHIPKRTIPKKNFSWEEHTREITYWRPSQHGRFPANLIHDGSEEVTALFPQTGNTGSAARFFYCTKAGKKDRAGSKHPTVKPIKLLRYLVRLVTPPSGTVLDPFAGTGTLAEAALLEGFSPVLIEREEEYQADIVHRLETGFPGQLEVLE